MIFFLKTAELTSAHCSRFGPLPLPTNLDGTPPGVYKPLPGSDGYHNDVGTPPLSIASDTRHSSHRRPHQCRTLARSPAPRTQSPVCSSARGVAQLHIKGVYDLSLPQRQVIHQSARGNPRDQGNNALHQDFEQLDDRDADGRGWIVFRPFQLSWLCVL